MLTEEELLILAAAATGGQGEYCISRDYNKPWGEECAAMKHLENLGFMTIISAGRVSPSQQYFPSIRYHRRWPAALAAITP